MSHRLERRLLMVCLLAMTLVLALTVQAAAPSGLTTAKGAPGSVGAGQPEALTAAYEVSEADQLEGAAMWAAREQRLSAKPMPWPEVSASDLMDSGAEPLGEPGFVAGQAPDMNADLEAMSEFPEEWQTLLEELDAEELDELDADLDGTKAVYHGYRTNYYTRSWKQYPYNTVGKLYITGGGYCSAAVIGSGTSSKNYRRTVIVTAGHCVYDRSAKKWYSGWTFYPAYRNGVAPYGSFSGWRARTLSNYISTGARRYDVAVISLNRNSAGKKASQYTGKLGRSWNYGYKQSLVATGYPSNLSTGTLYTHSCGAESFYSSTDVLGMGCNMEHGSSGGPWIRKYYPYSSGAKNYANAVVSGGTPGTKTFYGPRFSSNNIVPLCNDEGC